MPEILLPAVELVALVLGITALIVLFAMYLPARVLREVLSHVWLVGSQIAGVVDHWLLSAMGTVAGWMKDLTLATMHLIWAMVTVPWWLLSATVDAIANAHGWARQAFDRAVRAESNAESFATAQVGALGASVGSAFQFVDGQVAGIGADVAGIPADIAQAVSAGVDLAETQAERVARDAIDAAVLPIEAEVAAVQALTGELQGTVGGIEALIPPWIGTVPDLINGAITQALGQAATHADQVAQSAATAAATAAGAAAVTAAVSEVMPAVDALTAEAEACLAPLCDGANQLGDLGKLLKLLEALFGAAALTALLVGAVEDPKGTGDTVRTVMSWATTAGDDMAHLIFDLAHVNL